MCSKTSIRASVILFVTYLLLIYQGAFAADKQVLQGIQISEKKDSVVIQMSLSVPVRHIKHFPERKGEILQIQLGVNASELAPELQAMIKSRESMLPPVNNLVPLAHVTYEGDIPGGPYLTLRFHYAVEYSVFDGQASRNFNTISVIVKRTADGEKISGQKEERAPEMTESKIEEVMREARREITRKDYNRAIQLYSKILRLPDHKFSQDAKEFLGLARERDGQIARARLEYQEFMRLYPKGEATERVKKRLAALESRRERKKKLREVKKKEDWHMDTFGRISQRLYSLISRQRTTLNTNFNLSSRIRYKTYDIRGILNANDLRDLARASRNRFRWSVLNVDGRDRESGVSLRAGRQSSSKSGIFGRFDGVFGGYKLNKQWEFNAAIGKPVDFYSNPIELDQSFFSGSAQFGPFYRNWDANAYLAEQRINGLVDRRALGGDIRFSHKRGSFFQYIDYDVSYGQMNILMLRGGWSIGEDIKMNVSYNRRRNPIIATSNAIRDEHKCTGDLPTCTFNEIELIESFDELKEYGESAIRKKVADQFSISELYSFRTSYEINKNVQVSGDITYSTLSDTPAVASISQYDNSKTTTSFGSPGSEGDYSLSAQFIASNMVVERDIYIFGVRYSDRKPKNIDNTTKLVTIGKSDSYGLFVRNRFPFRQSWLIGPRIQFDQYNSSSSPNRRRYAASAKADFRWKKKINFEVEIGYEFNQYLEGISQDYSSINFSLGHYVNF